MKLLFCDRNEELVASVAAAWPKNHYVKCEFVVGDVIKEASRRGYRVVTCSNPSFSMGGGLDAAVEKAYPQECRKPTPWTASEHCYFAVTVGDDLKATASIVANALRNVIGNRHLGLAFTGLGTGIGSMSVKNFILCLSYTLKNFNSDEGELFDASGLIGYKATGKDRVCRDYSFSEIGKTHDSRCDDPKLCAKGGFHFCRSATETLDFYPRLDHLLEVSVDGKCRETRGKLCASSLKVTRDLTSVMRQSPYLNSGNLNSGYRNSGHQNSGDLNSGNLNSGYLNSGNRNSGNRNSGNLNSGDWNSGYRNSGFWNSGYRNSGSWNSGSWNSGYFNVDEPKKIRCFGKMVDIDKWDKAEKPNFLSFQTCSWVTENEMTDKEKEAHPQYLTTGGYLKTTDYKSAFVASYESLSPEERERQVAMLRKLPRFDAEIFEKISGIELPPAARKPRKTSK